jgi:hypothetical protein
MKVLSRRRRVGVLVTPFVLGFALLPMAVRSEAQVPEPLDLGTSDPSEVVTVTGAERLGWDQRIDGPALGELQFACYVTKCSTPDCTSAGPEQRFALDITCDVGPDGKASCSAPLPPLGSGVSKLELVSSYDDGEIKESARSDALVVQFATPSAEDAQDHTGPETSDVLQLAALDDEHLAIVSSRAVWIAHAGSIDEEPLLVAEHLAPGGRLLGLAPDFEFRRTRVLYVAYLRPAARDGSELAVARAREVDGRAGEVATLWNEWLEADEIPASGVRMRVGADRKIYVAVPDSDVRRLADNPVSSLGKLLRLNSDGTVPDDNPIGLPAVSAGYDKPIGLGWDAEGGRLLVLDAGSSGLRAVDAANSKELVRFAAPHCTSGLIASTGLLLGCANRVEWWGLPAGSDPCHSVSRVFDENERVADILETAGGTIHVLLSRAASDDRAGLRLATLAWSERTGTSPACVAPITR